MPISAPPRSLGIGQAFENHATLSTRLWNTTYTNSTNKPIWISVIYVSLSAASNAVGIQVNSGSGFTTLNEFVQQAASPPAIAFSVLGIVPPGWTYRITATGAGVTAQNCMVYEIR